MKVLRENHSKGRLEINNPLYIKRFSGKNLQGNPATARDIFTGNFFKRGGLFI